MVRYRADLVLAKNYAHSCWYVRTDEDPKRYQDGASGLYVAIETTRHGGACLVQGFFDVVNQVAQSQVRRAVQADRWRRDVEQFLVVESAQKALASVHVAFLSEDGNTCHDATTDGREAGDYPTVRGPYPRYIVNGQLNLEELLQSHVADAV